MAEVSVDSSTLLSYLLPEQSFVQVLVHGMWVLAVYDALHSPSLRQSSIELLGVEFVCSGLCVARCCVRVFGALHPVIIAGCFFNHTSSFIQLVDSAEFGIIAFFQHFIA